ncbi:MAG TPA: DUF169 domain-containing protein [Terracidiphilus sp.]|jgi:uncharacterized protein (DUF169 family)|nr:DUF169 domain-containing protein [Terracidiphilus sp.]
MKNYAALARELVDLLHLELPPIAISFSESRPEAVKQFDGQAPAGCRFWQEAATSVFTTSARDHELCAIGVHTHNLQASAAQQKDLMDALKVFSDLGYVRAEDVPQIPVLKTPAQFITYAPLSQAPLQADVVLLFIRSDQTLILSEATQQIESDHAPAMGRPACAVVAQVMNSGKAAMSLGCCGARAYLDTFTDEKAIFAIPGEKIQVYVDQVRTLAKANGILSQFHQLRRTQIAAGARPTIEESLTAFMGQA